MQTYVLLSAADLSAGNFAHVQSFIDSAAKLAPALRRSPSTDSATRGGSYGSGSGPVSKKDKDPARHSALWTLYVMDRLVCMVLGGACCVLDDQMTEPLPSGGGAVTHSRSRSEPSATAMGAASAGASSERCADPLYLSSPDFYSWPLPTDPDLLLLHATIKSLRLYDQVRLFLETWRPRLRAGETYVKAPLLLALLRDITTLRLAMDIALRTEGPGQYRLRPQVNACLAVLQR